MPLESARTALEALKQAVQELERSLEQPGESLTIQDDRLKALQERLTLQQAELTALHSQLDGRERETAYKVALALTLANSAYDALFVLNERHEIIAINDIAETLFNVQRPIGRSIEDVTGTPELDLMVAAALENRAEAFEEQLAIGRRMYRVQARVIEREQHTFIGLALQDVTELVRLNRARRDMVANISHELRHPIARINMIIEGLFLEQEKPKRKQSTSALKAIQRETNSLVWILQELLDLSMIESGQAMMRLVEYQARLLGEETVERLSDQSEAKQLRIDNQIPPDTWVLADPEQAQRVLVNLVHNAVKWSPPGETITIHAESTEDEVIFSVIDAGPGVPEGHRERIFERFYQVDSARSGGDGTGLGLAICKHIVEAHGGRIWVEDNSSGRGACFVFTLPSGNPPL